jgi:capsular exopolysaccharide synthesis family protein
MYRSSARILIEESMPKVLNMDDLLSTGARNVEYFNTHILALSSRSMVEAVMIQKDLASNPRFVPASLDPARKVSAALGFVRIEAVPRSRLIDIAVEHADPKLAADFANGLAEQYIEANLSHRADTSQESFGWLKKLADEYREKIEKDRTAIHEYRKGAKEVSLEENENIVVGKLKAVSADLTAAESERTAAEAEWNKVSEAIKTNQLLERLSVIGQDEAVKVAQGELQRKKSAAALLRTRYQEKHPSVIKAANEERELQSLYDRACQEAARRVESRCKVATEKVTGLREALARQEAEALELDRKLVKYNELKREVDADQQMYDTIVARMKEAKVGVDIKASNIRLVDLAEPALQPFRPLWPKAMLTSLLLGVALGIAAVLALYFLDDRLRRAEEVEHALGLRLLTVVPPVDSKRIQDRSLVAEKNSRAPASEAFRSVRASLAMRPDWHQERRLMITSTTAGEGKSLVATNFGIVLAHDGQRTLLIDGDMRRPTVHRAFGLEMKDGLSGLLMGECTLEQALHATKIPNLTVIVAGKEPENPSELLGSSAMKKLLESLGEKFDRIVVDCPPVFGVSDPISLLPVMDGAIFVVHYGRTGRRAAVRAIGRLQEGIKPVIGVIFNNVPITRSSGYNYYYRYYGYGKDRGASSRKPGKSEDSKR